MNTCGIPSESLIAALSAAHIPIENHEFVRKMTEAVGIDAYRFVDQPGKRYVIARRKDGLRDLHIYYGATNGFYSEDEVIRIAGHEADRRPSGSRKGTWCVIHPEHQSRPPGPRFREARREGTRCDCGMQLSLTGVCASCD